MVALRGVEVELLKLMNIRSGVEREIISHHMTVTEERSKDAEADLVCVAKSRVPCKDLPPYQGPVTSDPVPQAVTTLFFRHYINEHSVDQSAVQSPPRSTRSSLTSSATPSTSMASAILPPPSALSAAPSDKPLLSNRRMSGRRPRAP